MKLIDLVKKNLILEHNEDDDLLEAYIETAVKYAEEYQHKALGFYAGHPMTATTRQGVVLLVCHLYESRDGSTGGFFNDNTAAAKNAWTTINFLLRLDREWKV